jgi:hypothetical protein
MKKIISLLLIATSISSCSFFNDKAVTVPISSSPPGASLYINGQYYGTTPTVVKLVPTGTYYATLNKEGYGSAKVSLETWLSVRGGRGGDSFRCVMDSLGFILVIPAISNVLNCRDFKLDNYVVSIPNSGNASPDAPMSGASTSGAAAPSQVQQYQNPPMNDYQQYAN